MTIYCDHLCENCRVWLEPTDGPECRACVFLRTQAGYKLRLWGETEGTVNRRWQMRFNRRELADVHGDGGVKWETKRAIQTW